MCEYTLLSDNEYPTYAVIKKELSESGIKEKKKIRRGEEPGCVVLELGYFIDFRKKSMEDPLSVVLSLTDEEKQDDIDHLGNRRIRCGLRNGDGRCLSKRRNAQLHRTSRVGMCKVWHRKPEHRIHLCKRLH